MLQESLPFALHLSSVSAVLDENGPPVMSQIAHGGYSPTPPEEDTGVPHARGQTPPSSSNLEGIEPLAPRRCAKPGVEPLVFRFRDVSTSQLDQTERVRTV